MISSPPQIHPKKKEKNSKCILTMIALIFFPKVVGYNLQSPLKKWVILPCGYLNNRISVKGIDQNLLTKKRIHLSIRIKSEKGSNTTASLNIF
jgi:hypothetical protein